MRTKAALPLLRDLVDRRVQWHRVRKRWWELRADGLRGEPLARLYWPKLFSSLGVAEVGRDTWEFRKLGFFRTRVVVRRPGSERDVAVLTRRWTGGGMLEIPGQRRFTWSRNGWLSRRWSFIAEDGTPVVSFQRVGVFRPRAEVQVHQSGPRYDQLPLLLTLGWHLLVLEQHEAAAAG